MTNHPNIKTIYRSRVLSKLLWFIIWSGAAYFLIFFLRDLILGTTGEYSDVGYVVLLLGLILLMNHAFQMMILNEVILSEDGIEIRRGGIRVFTTWDNFQGFVNGFVTGSSRKSGRGIYFRKEVPVEARGLSNIFNRSEIDYIKIDCNVQIPMTFYTMKLKKDALLKTDFGQAVNHFKPSIFR